MGNCITSEICCIRTDKKIESVRLENQDNGFHKKIKHLSMKISNKSTAQNTIIKRKRGNEYLTEKPRKIVFLHSESNHSFASLNNHFNNYSENELYEERKKKEN